MRAPNVDNDLSIVWEYLDANARPDVRLAFLRIKHRLVATMQSNDRMVANLADTLAALDGALVTYTQQASER